MVKRLLSFILALIFAASPALSGMVRANSDIIIEPGDGGFFASEKWYESGLKTATGKATLYTGAVGSYASYSAAVLQTGSYHVLLYKIVHTTQNDTNTKVEISHDGQTDTVFADFSAGETGWEYMGTYHFNGEADEYIKVERSEESSEGSLTRTGGVKFILSDGTSYSGLDDGSASAGEEPEETTGETLSYHGAVTLMSNEIELLSALGVFKEFPPPAGTDYRYLTRAEFTVCAMRLAGMDGIDLSLNSEQVFADVPLEHPAFSSILSAVHMGVISKPEHGSFYPADPVKLEEAIKILVTILGYHIQAKQSGDYPYNYRMVGDSKGLTAGIAAKMGDHVDLTMAMKMVYNALDINLFEETAIGRGTYAENPGQTLLAKYFDIYKAKGLLTISGGASLAPGARLRKGYVKVGESVYRTQEDSERYLGHHVTLYHKKAEGDGTESAVVCIWETPNQNEVETINADDIIAAKQNPVGTEITYDLGQSGKTKTIQVKSGTAVLYNYCLIPDFTAADFQPVSGKITAIDNNTDGNFDVVFVLSETTYLVERVNEDAGSIDLKYGKGRIELDTDAVVDYTIKNSYGKELALADLKPWNVISVLEKHSSYSAGRMVITVSDKKVEGTVSEVYEVKEKVMINEKTYQIAQSYRELTAMVPQEVKEITVNDSGTFYLDSNGNIAGFAAADGSKDQYGYAYKIAADKSIGMDVRIKLLTESNKWELLRVADQVALNDRMLAAGELFNSDLVDLEQEAAEVVIEPGDSGFSTTGVWHESGLKTPSGNSSLFATAVGAGAEYSAAGLKPGAYRVYLYKLVSTSLNDTGLRTNIAHKNGTDTFSVNFNEGTNGWEYLGDFEFSASATENVTVLKVNASCNSRTAGVKFERIDGDSGSPGSSLHEGLFVLKPVYFERNSRNEINKINTLELSSEEAQRRYKSAVPMFLSADNKSVDFLVNSNTFVIALPAKLKQVPEGEADRKVAVYQPGRFMAEQSYTVASYEEDKSKYARVIVMTYSDVPRVNTTVDQNIIVADRIVQGLNHDGEVVNKLIGWQAGKEIGLVAERGYDDIFSGLGAGDVLLVNKNNANEVNAISVLHSNKADAEFKQTGAMIDRFATVYGRILEIYNESSNLIIDIDGSGNVENASLYCLLMPVVYICDAKKNSIGLASPKDYRIGDKILVRFRTSRGMEAVIYRNFD